MSLIEGRMTQFVARETGLSRSEAFALQKKYLSEHGTTLAGLMANHGVDPEAFLNEVHDVSMASLTPESRSARGHRRPAGPAAGVHQRRPPPRRAGADQAPTRRPVRGDLPHRPGGLHPQAASQDLRPDDRGLADVDPATSTRLLREIRRATSPPAHDLGMTTVLVGPQALASDHPFVHHRTDNLAAFLAAAPASRRPPHERPSIHHRSRLGRPRRRQSVDHGRGARGGRRGADAAGFRQGAGGRKGRQRLDRASVAEEGGAAVLPPQSQQRDGRRYRRRGPVVRQGGDQVRRLDPGRFRGGGLPRRAGRDGAPRSLYRARARS